jgi:hypothetical protein
MHMHTTSAAHGTATPTPTPYTTAQVLRAADIAEQATKAIYPAILAAVLEALRAADLAKGDAA